MSFGRGSCLVIAVLALACGGRTPLEGSDYITSGGGGGGDGGIVPGEDGSVIIDDASTIGPDASLVDTGVIGVDASTVPDGTTIDVGVIDAVVDTGSGIACGAQSCDPTSQECCLTFGGMGGETCVPTGSCPGLALACTGPETCMNGDVCCITFQGGAPGSACMPMCQGGPRLCQTDQDCTPRRPHCVAGPLGLMTCRR